MLICEDHGQFAVLDTVISKVALGPNRFQSGARKNVTLSEKKARLETWNTKVANCIDICLCLWIGTYSREHIFSVGYTMLHE